MSVRTDHIDIRVFIEGILVPHVSVVTVSSESGMSSTATLVLPPVPGFEYEALTRTRVHVFWSDSEIRRSRDEDEWPLLFEGEIVGDSFQKTPMSRNIVLRCAGYHTYWEQALISYYDLSQSSFPQSINTPRTTAFIGSRQIVMNAPVAGADVKSTLIARFKSDLDKEYHASVVSALVESIGNNKFMDISDSALKLKERFLAPRDQFLTRLISREKLVELLSNEVTSISGQRSLMSVMTDVLSVMRYQVLVNCQPRPLARQSAEGATAARVSLSPLDRLRNQVSTILVGMGVRDDIAADLSANFKSSVTARELSQTLDDAFRRSGVERNPEADKKLIVVAIEMATAERQGTTSAASPSTQTTVTPELGQYLFVPDTRFAAVPRCNVIFPEAQTSIGFDRNLLEEPTRLFVPASASSPSETHPVFIAPSSLADDAVLAESTFATAAVNTQGLSPPIVGNFFVTSAFGWRIHPIRKKPQHHQGVDLDAPLGTPIHAINSGKVAFSGVSDSAGYHVRIVHDDGSQSTYMHMIAGSLTKRSGDLVAAGEVIGQLGKTGKVTGAHLHLEWKVKGVNRDPLEIIRATSDSRGTSAAGRLLFRGRGSQPALASAQTLAVESQAEQPTMADGMSLATVESQFRHWDYLTPEEQKKGIMPIFDVDTAKNHTAFLSGNEVDTIAYLTSIVETEFLWRRYLTRSMPTIEMPLNVNVVAGFPALVVDSHRSIIGLVSSVSHNISVGGGSGNATTSVSLVAPRFWDEGDPYFWRGGREVIKADGPDLSVANFPIYYLSDLVPTNSASGYDVAEPWGEGQSVDGDVDRPVDRLYQLLLGCPAIPYEHGERTSLATGAVVSYNKAIDRPVGSEEDDELPRTLAGHYRVLGRSESGIARAFVSRFTAREMVTERHLMTSLLGSSRDSSVSSRYTGPAFREDTQGLISAMVKTLSHSRAFRG